MTLCSCPSCARSRAPEPRARTARARTVAKRRFMIVSSTVSGLEPQPQPSNESSSARVFASGLGEVGGLPPFVAPSDTEIRRELAPHLVAQTESKVGGAEPCSHTAFRIRFAEQFCLKER